MSSIRWSISWFIVTSWNRDSRSHKRVVYSTVKYRTRHYINARVRYAVAVCLLIVLCLDFDLLSCTVGGSGFYYSNWSATAHKHN